MSDSILEQLKKVLGDEVETNFSYESNERINYDRSLIEEQLIDKSPEVIEKFLIAFDNFLFQVKDNSNLNSFRYNKDGINIFIPIQF